MRDKYSAKWTRMALAAMMSQIDPRKYSGMKPNSANWKTVKEQNLFFYKNLHNDTYLV